MAKFNYRVIQNKTTWTAEIIRKATANKMVVSTKQGGFTTEEEAETWAKSKLETFVKELNDKRLKASEAKSAKEANL
jgi:frataxin-like iron-binding protein CyaY